MINENKGTNVRVLLDMYFSCGQIVVLMYLSKSGEISKRNVKVIKIQGESFQAYCFKRNAKRTFLIDNVLALVPVILKERNLI
ncbi:transcriptional regulator [Psychrobacillus sp. L4]|uniref:transcriptional regulator n=1 Tax=Psychrobacillus sp. L4 TaxID=3236892 RepID=UPI0036F2ED51